ncbi:MAG: hypothetical protein KBA60_03320 [Flavobacteriales bacterium]|nr:hypothetical protein [Flavobacteriales bacterium]MBP6641702.1 hypothetical protein [Flavobacteriales bacterium]MBP7155012.1 hypothetical protein [Flavobacteriales bacterium]HQV74204.1 hypothetical protein [Flavobacteriales bacterium]HQW40601.1 hypothetical protein [Flavobacteriales bacterium]
MKKVLLFLSLLFIVFVSCSKDELEEGLPGSPAGADRLVLNVNEFPYTNLSEYRFFKGPMADQRPRTGVIPYEPITALFTDYAHKKRFVWMPEGSMAHYAGDHVILDMPDGTVLIKNFYYDNVAPTNTTRIIETRILYKRDGLWEFAEYVWNAEQTDATFNMSGSNTPITWTDEENMQQSINYRIPAEAECHTCHKYSGLNTPIGPKPQNLNSTYPYTSGDRNQLIEWVRNGYLANDIPKRINTTVRWNDTSQDLETRVRSYLDMNCAHCHSDNTHCDYRSMRFAFSETTQPENLGECVPPDDPIAEGQTHIVARGNAARSMLYYRINSTNEAERMPLLGRTVVHQEGVALIQEWINQLSPPCP